MDTSQLFDHFASRYAASRPHYPTALFDYLAGLTETRERAWDCATGNGQAALGLARHFGQIEATDISAGQIEQAFEDERLRFTVEAAESRVFEANTFDLVSVAQALHWFDLDRFWPEVGRALKPTGVFACYCYSWHQVSSEIDAVTKTSIRDVIEPYWSAQNRLSWDRYDSIDFPFDRLETPQFEMENLWDLNQYLDYMSTWSASDRCLKKLGDAWWLKASKQIGDAWGDAKGKRMIKMPLTLIAGRAWI
ncbi:MAG: class I SAM-dependent methyltransferase [Verrucomicrobiia bacterium]|jgi:SAM-dependent methyltransferase